MEKKVINTKKSTRTKYQDVNWVRANQLYWSEGCTLKEASQILGVGQKLLSRGQKEGLLKLRSRTERKHTLETRRKISAARRRYMKEHPEQLPYLLNHRSHGPSYPERYFREALQQSQYQTGVTMLTYELDFANVTSKIDFEVDGSQHYNNDDCKSHDLRRNHELASIGWTVIRLNWAIFKRLALSQREKIVQELRAGIFIASDVLCVLSANSNPDFIRTVWERFIGDSLAAKNYTEISRKDRYNARARYRRQLSRLRKELERRGVDFTKLSLDEIAAELKLTLNKPNPTATRKTKIVWPSDKELQELVWKTPMMHLAKKLGVSDRAIKKHCERRRIPTPDVRYWRTEKYAGT